MHRRLVIYGAGTLGRLARFHFEREHEVEVVAFVCDAAYCHDTQVDDLPLLPFERVHQAFPPSLYGMFVAVGYKRMRNRQLMYTRAKEKGYRCPNLISPKAITYDNLQIGENNLIFGGGNIEPFVVIGNNNVVWSDTLLGHGLKLGSHNYISAKCIISGDSEMGDLCFVGNGVTTIDSLRIEDEAMLIAGAVLFENARAATKYLGNPAKCVGTHQDTGIIVARDHCRKVQAVHVDSSLTTQGAHSA